MPNQTHPLCGNLRFAERAQVVLPEPVLDATRMEGVPYVAWQRRHVLSLREVIKADGTLLGGEKPLAELGTEEVVDEGLLFKVLTGLLLVDFVEGVADAGQACEHERADQDDDHAVGDAVDDDEVEVDEVPVQVLVAG